MRMNDNNHYFYGIHLLSPVDDDLVKSYNEEQVGIIALYRNSLLRTNFFIHVLNVIVYLIALNETFFLKNDL